MDNIYENIVIEFNKKNCRLLTTKEEHINILNNSKKCNYKLNHIASCGHNHEVFYNVFKTFSAVKARGLTPISPNSNVPCCMCDREFPRESMFIPLACLNKNHERAHRICSDCW